MPYNENNISHSTLFSVYLVAVKVAQKFMITIIFSEIQVKRNFFEKTGRHYQKF